MARNTGAVCRLCRREGAKLFLKGTRCDSPKCGLTRRDFAPGMHSWRRRKASQYRKQLREEQKLKRTFGLYQRQFHKYFLEAARAKGDAGGNLLSLIERRLDNIVYRGGLALSRPLARQMINHGHIAVNGGKVDIASYIVRPGDVVSAVAREKNRNYVKEQCGLARGITVPSWLEADTGKASVTVKAMPTRDEFPIQLEEQLVVELCSK